MDRIVAQMRAGRVVLVIAPWRANQGIMLSLAARLAVRGGVEIMDGGEVFDVFQAARLIRRQTQQLPTALRQIKIARAFTPYQMLSLLERVPETRSPKLVLDLLATYYDSSLPASECARLLRESMEILGRLNRLAPVVVSARPPRSENSERAGLLHQLRASGDNLVCMEYFYPQKTAELLFGSV